MSNFFHMQLPFAARFPRFGSKILQTATLRPVNGVHPGIEAHVLFFPLFSFLLLLLEEQPLKRLVIAPPVKSSTSSMSTKQRRERERERERVDVEKLYLPFLMRWWRLYRR